MAARRPRARPVLRAATLEELTSARFLAPLVGPVREVTRAPMGTAGFSSSAHARIVIQRVRAETLTLVFKETDLAADWTAFRSDDDRGREALLLVEPELADAWEIFVRPHVAYALEPGRVGLLMHDLTPHLLPDVREPVAAATEDAVLERLAWLHARFWNADATDLPWLARHEHFLSALGPRAEADGRPAPRGAFGQRVREGWTEALWRLPSGVAGRLTCPAAELAREAADLPCTLVHGDVKLANFAYADARVAAFDWAMAGRAPAAVDLGWYLAVNAPRLARPKEAVIARYRELLEQALAAPLDDALWARTTGAAILAGALMLLWSKALAVRDGRPGAEREWEWWVRGL